MNFYGPVQKYKNKRIKKGSFVVRIKEINQFVRAFCALWCSFTIGNQHVVAMLQIAQSAVDLLKPPRKLRLLRRTVFLGIVERTEDVQFVLFDRADQDYSGGLNLIFPC